MKNGGFPMKNGDFPIKNGGFPMKNAGFPAVFGMSCRTLSDLWEVFFPQNPAHCPTHRSMLPEVSLLWYLCSRVLLEISDRCVFWMVETGAVPA